MQTAVRQKHKFIPVITRGRGNKVYLGVGGKLPKFNGYGGKIQRCAGIII